VARRVAIVFVIIAILLLVIPLGIGMAMGACPECNLGSSIPAPTMCLAVLAGFSAAFGAAFTRRAHAAVARPLPPPFLPIVDPPPRHC
jgi:hypothetical protein